MIIHLDFSNSPIFNENPSKYNIQTYFFMVVLQSKVWLYTLIYATINDNFFFCHSKQCYNKHGLFMYSSLSSNSHQSWVNPYSIFILPLYHFEAHPIHHILNKNISVCISKRAFIFCQLLFDCFFQKDCNNPHAFPFPLLLVNYFFKLLAYSSIIYFKIYKNIHIDIPLNPQMSVMIFLLP